MANLIKSVFKKLFWRCQSEAISRVEIVDQFIRQLVDVKNIPAARGFLRVHQLASTVLLKRICNVLHQNSIPYWISYGTLLGAVRHGGFIPWDDDIDICVMRTDYYNVEKLINDSSIKLKCIVQRSDCIRVWLRDLSCQVDIFPVDIFGCDESFQKARSRILSTHKHYHSKVEYDWNRLKSGNKPIINLSESEIDSMARKISAGYIGDNKYLMLGFEAIDVRYEILRYEDIFPLRRLKFEGIGFYAPACPQRVLATYYGDYMVLPSKCCSHDDIQSRVNIDSCLKMMEIIESDGSFGPLEGIL